MRRTAGGLLGAGLLMLSFVAYQLWGTSLYEHSAQNRLEQQLRTSLHDVSDPKTPVTVPADEVVSKAAPPTADPPLGDAVGLLSIPAIGLASTAIVEGTAEAQLDTGPGHYVGTPLPGEVGNVAIAGHRTTYGAPFYNLSSLQDGDAINIETPQGFFEYKVTGSQVVSPTDTAVLDDSALPTLTLTTCNPRYSSTSRLVVTALLATSIINTSFIPVAPPSGSRSQPKAVADNKNAAGSHPGMTSQVMAAVLWGLGTVIAVVIALLVYRRLAGSARLLTVVGAGAGIFCLLACYQHISLALPASF